MVNEQQLTVLNNKIDYHLSWHQQFCKLCRSLMHSDGSQWWQPLVNIIIMSVYLTQSTHVAMVTAGTFSWWGLGWPIGGPVHSVPKAGYHICWSQIRSNGICSGHGSHVGYSLMLALVWGCSYEYFRTPTCDLCLSFVCNLIFLNQLHNSIFGIHRVW